MSEITSDFARKLDDGDPAVKDAFYQLLGIRNQLVAELEECKAERQRLAEQLAAQKPHVKPE